MAQYHCEHPAIACAMIPPWFNQLGLVGYPLAGCSSIAGMACFDRTVLLIPAILNQEKRYQ